MPASRVLAAEAEWTDRLAADGDVRVTCDIDDKAVSIALGQFGLPPSVHVPVAARDVTCVERYVGQIERIVSGGPLVKAVCVRVRPPANLDRRLPIWKRKQSARLYARRQLWVHVDYTRYRKAYAVTFLDENLQDAVVDHVMNRHAARLKGFMFVRVVAIARAANCSSGGLVEKWGIALQHQRIARGEDPSDSASIQYADLPDLVKLLDINTGGGVQDAVNEAQRLVEP